MAEAQAPAGSSSDVTSPFQALNINEEKNIYILLLGPSQAGLSTFVNAFANYLSYRNLDSAENEKLVVVVPASYTNIIDKDHEEHEVQVAPDLSEDESCDYDTIRTYSIPLNDRKTKLHMICVPAVENSSDEDEEDNSSWYEDILFYIAQIETLHAICCIMPVNVTNDSTLNLFFEQCFYTLLPHLNDQIYKNLIFLFTHSQATYYKAGTSLSLLKKFLNNPGNSSLQQKINFEAKNTFYFENNSFIYLAARQVKIEFDVDVKKRYSETWYHSYKELLRFVDYITGSDSEKSLTPYSVTNTASVIMVRWTIIKLLQPIADLLDLIKNNLTTLQDRWEFFCEDNLTPQDVEGKLNIPGFTLKVTRLPVPVTMCANGETNKCAISHTVGNIQTWRMERCCERCFLNTPPRYLIGDMSLLACDKMEGEQSDDIDDTKCCNCKCNTYNHMHLYYLTKLEQTTSNHLPPTGLLSEKIESITKEITDRIKEYENEMKIIVESAAEFVQFMQNEGIAPYEDPYEMYIQYLINRESILGNEAGDKNIQQMNTFLEYYRGWKDTLAQASVLSERLGDEICLPLGKVTPEKVMKSVDVLYSLKHTGSKIKELVESQHIARREEHRHSITEIKLFNSKDITQNNPQKRFRNTKNWHDGDDKNQRGNFRARGNRGRYGGYRGNFHHNSNIQQANTDDTKMSQPPAYSELYPNNNAASFNLNSLPPSQQVQSATPYVQINVINDSHSQRGNSRQTDSYRSDQGRGGYCQQTRGGFKANRGGFRGNRGVGNRNWNTNRQNRSGCQQNTSQNEPCNQSNANKNQQNTGCQRQQLPADNQRQSTSYNKQSNRGVNQQQNTRYNQNPTGNNQQRRAAGSYQHQNVGSGQQNNNQNQQKNNQNPQQRSNQSNQGSAGFSRRQNTNEQPRAACTQGTRSIAQTGYRPASLPQLAVSQQRIRSYAKKKDKVDCAVM